MGERVRWGKKGREVESERGGRIEKEILRQRGGSSASAYGFESMNQSRILHAYYVIIHLSNQHKDTQRHKETQNLVVVMQSLMQIKTSNSLRVQREELLSWHCSPV